MHLFFFAIRFFVCLCAYLVTFPAFVACNLSPAVLNETENVAQNSASENVTTALPTTFQIQIVSGSSRDTSSHVKMLLLAGAESGTEDALNTSGQYESHVQASKQRLVIIDIVEDSSNGSNATQFPEIIGRYYDANNETFENDTFILMNEEITSSAAINETSNYTQLYSNAANISGIPSEAVITTTTDYEQQSFANVTFLDVGGEYVNHSKPITKSSEVLSTIGLTTSKSGVFLVNDVDLNTALIVSLVVIAVLAIFSLCAIIIWRRCNRQLSGEWVLNKNVNHQRPFVYGFENECYSGEGRKIASNRFLPTSAYHDDTKYQLKGAKMDPSMSLTNKTPLDYSDPLRCDSFEQLEMMEMVEKKGSADQVHKM